jgi:ACT domain-containing protein
MRIKLAILVVIVLSIVQTFGQTKESVKDYFIPIAGKNMVTFNGRSNTVEEYDIIRSIYYNNRGDFFDIINTSYSQGKTLNVQTRTVKFTNTDVKLVNSFTTSILEASKSNTYDPAGIVLRMPPLGQTVTWYFKEESGDLKKYTSSWTTVIVNGEIRKAIKVSNPIDRWKLTDIDYYVKGIGLWKNEIFQWKDKKVTTMEKFGELSFESKAE